MLIFNIPIHPPLRLLINELLDHDVDIYLSGPLGENLLYVDICHKIAAIISPGLPQEWALIYPYFLSSEACIRGEDDYLISKTNEELRSLLRITLGAQHESDDIFEEDVDGAMAHIEFLLKRQPSRLVFMGGGEINKEDIKIITGLIAASTNSV